MLALLRRRDFALLWFGGLISLTGDRMLYVALPIYVYQLTGSALATSAMFMVGMLPPVLLGSVAGVFVDRWDRKRTMVVSNLLQMAVVLLLLLVRSAQWLWLVYAVALVQSVAGQFFGPAENALLPSLVGEEHLVAANSLNGLNNNLARLLGPPVGGMVAGLTGLGGVALADSASFLIAALMIGSIAAPSRPPREGAIATRETAMAWPAVWREWLEGLRLVRRERLVLVVFALGAVLTLADGVFSPLLVVFVSEVLGGGAPEIGWLFGADAVRGLVGAAIVGYVGGRLGPVRLIALGTVTLGLIHLAIFNVPAVVPSPFTLILILFGMGGIPLVAWVAGVTTLQQTAVADEYRGRIFGAFGAVLSLAKLIGLVLAGALEPILGVITVLHGEAVTYLLAGAMALALLPTAARRDEPVVTDGHART